MMASRIPSLADQAFDVVERMIVTLELDPGTVFSEAELSERISIGRTPLREALLRLAGDQLIVTLPRRGMMVTDINIADYLALLDTRRELDRLVVTSAARRATPEQREAVRACGRELVDSAAAGDLSEFMRLDRHCDELLEAAAGNRYATRSLAPLHAHCRRFWYRYRHNGDLGASADLHARMMTAVADGDEAAAAQASDSLIDYLVEFTRSAMVPA
jgi:DNA-binding GntR family transcriptional regulator